MTETTPKKEFITNIQKWVAIDTQLHEIHEKTKTLREMKKELTVVIHQHVEENNMQKTVININDGELRFCEKKEYQGLTLGYIEKCLQNTLRDSHQIATIMQNIKSNRNIKTVKDISRNFKVATSN
jgi:septum formation topological specificity factor MinE